MIASAIAYFMVAFFLVFGVATIAVALNKAANAATTLWAFAASVAFFLAAWGCAYLGGI